MENSKFSVGKNVVVPLFCGIIGASLVIGGDYVFSKKNINTSNNGNTLIENTTSYESAKTNNINTSLISLTNYSDTSVAVAKKVLPSVVGIKVEYDVSSIFSRTTSTASAEGSGIIISDDGYILTNNHVISSSTSSSLFYELSEATKIIINLYNDDTEYEARVIGKDEQTDLAVLKIEKTGLTAATLGNSSSIQIGEFAMVIGNPLGMQNSVASGIISGTNRKITTDGKTYNVIQTDAAINSGNSGGALVNSKGEEIGINTLKSAGTGVEGLGFAIPIDTAKDIVEQLITYNKVKRPYLGFTGIDLTESLAKRNNLPEGIYVKTVEDFSSAEKAGLKVGDVILKFNGKQVKSMDEFNEIKNTYKIGDEVTLTILRSYIIRTTLNNTSLKL